MFHSTLVSLVIVWLEWEIWFFEKWFFLTIQDVGFGNFFRLYSITNKFEFKSNILKIIITIRTVFVFGSFKVLKNKFCNVVACNIFHGFWKIFLKPISFFLFFFKCFFNVLFFPDLCLLWHWRSPTPTTWKAKQNKKVL